MIRVLHFSDVHVQAPLSAMPASELMSKRLLGGLNLAFHRGHLFRDTPRKLEQLCQLAHEQRVDLALCTGDFTALGTAREHALAAELLKPLHDLPLGFTAVPGNHDLYLPDTLADARFEHAFTPLLAPRDAGTRYPLVRELGEGTTLVAINSARPNPNPFLSSGALGGEQLAALERVLEQRAGQTVLVMTHYAPLRKDGTPDTKRHGLDDARELLALCARPRVALLHGHIHWRYSHAAVEGRPWLFGAGSATHAGREGFWLYELEGGALRAIPGRYRDGSYVLEREGAVQVAW